MKIDKHATQGAVEHVVDKTLWLDRQLSSYCKHLLSVPISGRGQFIIEDVDVQRVANCLQKRIGYVIQHDVYDASCGSSTLIPEPSRHTG